MMRSWIIYFPIQRQIQYSLKFIIVLLYPSWLTAFTLALGVKNLACLLQDQSNYGFLKSKVGQAISVSDKNDRI